MSFNPAWWILHDIKAEWSARGTFPPGPTSFSLGRTHQMLVDPLHLLLDCYKEYGPVFSLLRTAASCQTARFATRSSR